MSPSDNKPIKILSSADLSGASSLTLKQQQDLNYKAAQQQRELKYKAADKGIDAVANLMDLAVKTGGVLLESKQLDDKLRAHREEVDNEIRKLDAASRRQVEQLAADLSKMQERTDQLQRLLSFMTTQGPNLHPSVAEGIGKAIHNLTQH